MNRVTLACAIAACLSTATAFADDKPAPTVTAQDILNILIQQGIVDEKKVEEVVKKAKDKTREQYQSGVEEVPPAQADQQEQSEGNVVRVPYVPKYIRDEIRDQVRSGLREDVVQDVMKKAEDERWGVPGTAPDWTQRIKFSGDVRLRAESIAFASDNGFNSYRDYTAINKRKQLDQVNDYLNTTEDRARMRTRLRFGAKAKVTQGVEAGVRLATGSTSNPVSTNETLGNYGNSFAVKMDRAYLKYTSFETDLTLEGGRFENPFFHTDLIWDGDLQFDGIAASYYWLRSNSWDDDDRQWDPFTTFGIFPIDEVEWSGKDKWLVGLQGGFAYHSWSQNILRFGLGYYQYLNMQGKRNAPDSDLYDYTAPGYMQKGNTVFNILNTTTPTDTLFALAYDYTIADALIEYDIAAFSPHHVILTAEYMKNIAADDAEASQLTHKPALDTKHDGFLAKIMFGWPIVAKPGDWQVAFSYRELHADAMVDGFTDSDFHLGGTDGRGYVIEGNYGLFYETWMTVKWMSSNEVDLDSLGVDIFQIDLNAKF